MDYLKCILDNWYIKDTKITLSLRKSYAKWGNKTERTSNIDILST